MDQVNDYLKTGEELGALIIIVTAHYVYETLLILFYFQKGIFSQEKLSINIKFKCAWINNARFTS